MEETNIQNSNTEETVVNGETNADNENGNGETEKERLYSQAEIDEMMSKRIGREKGKTKAMRDELEKLKSDSAKYKQLSKILSSTEAGKDIDGQIDYLTKYYDYKEDANNAPTNGDIAIATLEAQKFVKNADDEDIQDRMDELLSKKKLSQEETILKEEMAERYNKISFGKEVRQAKKWFEANCDGKFEDLIKSDDFAEFISGLNAKPTDLINKYAKIKGLIKSNETNKEKDSKPKPKSAGSVKDSFGNSGNNDYFSRDDVEKMSREEIKKNLDLIQKSMSKW